MEVLRSLYILLGLTQLLCSGSCLTHDSAAVSFSLQQLVQRRDVRLRHLQRLVLGELAVVAEGGDDVTEAVEGVVEAIHAAALPRVGGQTPSLGDVPGGGWSGAVLAVALAEGMPPRLLVVAVLVTRRPGRQFHRSLDHGKLLVLG